VSESESESDGDGDGAKSSGQALRRSGRQSERRGGAGGSGQPASPPSAAGSSSPAPLSAHRKALIAFLNRSTVSKSRSVVPLSRICGRFCEAKALECLYGMLCFVRIFFAASTSTSSFFPSEFDPSFCSRFFSSFHSVSIEFSFLAFHFPNIDRSFLFPPQRHT
jgi:hypothetical protein